MQIILLWPELNWRVTVLFYAGFLHWTKWASIIAVAEQMRLTSDEAPAIQGQAIPGGPARRQVEPVAHLSLVETPSQERHEYGTVIIDLEIDRVLQIGDNPNQGTVDAHGTSLSPEQFHPLLAIAMNMCGPCFLSTLDHVPDAENMTALDTLHVAHHLNDPVDILLARENPGLLSKGKAWLKGTKYTWLKPTGRFPKPKRIALGPSRAAVHSRNGGQP